ncbi:multidrug effflux MFS transporter [Martelella sp. HB161492]|uniref:multidrug effflux MFS transporter n=1 Tax=Martelella sp. HB161492 TaxID=2720726 RepID=UPI0015906C80|nr:multidrug effflux MFS transporter [Martelella sp. HB161492]
MSAHQETAQVTLGRARAITGVLALLSIFPPLATDMYLSALGDLASALNASPEETGLSLSLFFFGLCIGQLIMGPLIDAFGRRTPLLLGTLLFTLTSAALLMVDNIAIFNGLRLFQALGACAGMVVSRAVINDLYDDRRAAKALGVLVMLMTIGPIISPTLGSLLLEAFGWRSIFVTMLLVGIAALLLSYLIIPETLPRSKRADAPFRTAGRNARHLVTLPGFMAPAVVAGLVQGGMFAFITGSSGVFQGVFGLSSLAYGLVFAAIAMALVLFTQFNNRLLDHFAPQQIMAVGLPFYVVVTALTAAASASASIWLFTAPLWIAIGMVGLLSANAMAVTMAAAKQGAGIASALLGGIQFALAFAVSSCVAMGGSDTPLPMSLGLLLPAVLAWLLWFASRRNSAVASKAARKQDEQDHPA